MFARHGIRNALRTPKRSVAFLLLMTLLVTLLGTSLGLSFALQRTLRQCRENYSTIGLVEYLGPGYPSNTKVVADAGEVLAEFEEKLDREDPALVAWEPTRMALGYTPDLGMLTNRLLLKDRFVAMVKVRELATLHVPAEDGSGWTIDENGNIVAETPRPAYDRVLPLYDAIISRMLYTGQRMVDGSPVLLEIPGEASMDIPGQDYVPPADSIWIPRHYYLLHGSYAESSLMGASYMQLSMGQYELDGVDTGVTDVLDVTQPDGTPPRLDGSTGIEKVAQTYQVTTHSLTVQATDRPADLLPFQQGDLTLAEGAYYTASGKGCLISQAVAKDLGLSVGDSLPLSLAVRRNTLIPYSYWAGEGFDAEDTYTVSGIFSANEEYETMVYIPVRNDIDMQQNHCSFTLGQLQLKNDLAQEYIERLEKDLPSSIRVTVYDQGYAAVSQALEDMLRLVQIIAGVCLAAGLGFLVLFGYLLVYRQRGIGRTMIRVGAARRNVHTYFLFCAGTVALPAAGLGLILSRFVCLGVLKLLEVVLDGATSLDLYYSNTALAMHRSATEYLAAPGWGALAVIALGTLALALLSCLVFSVVSLERRHKKRRRESRAAQGTPSRPLRGGPRTYARLSVLRGGFRSLVPVLAGVCAAVLFCQLSGIVIRYDGQLRDLRANSSVRGNMTDISGKYTTGLVLDEQVLDQIGQLPGVSELTRLTATPYYFAGVYRGSELVAGPGLPPQPTTTFESERYMANLSSGPDLVFIDRLEGAPEFMYSTSIKTQWLEGYDSSCFQMDWDASLDPETAENRCVISTDMMDQYGIRLGDWIWLEVRCSSAYSYSRSQIGLRVVGAYAQTGRANNIYTNLSMLRYPYAYDEDLELCTLGGVYLAKSISGATFKIADCTDLTAVKQALYDMELSAVGKLRAVRNFVIINDAAYLNTERAAAQRLWYMQHLFPVVYAIALGLAYLIAFLQVQSRRKELRTMRSVGADSRTAYWSLYWEQLMLAALGAVLGAGLCLALGWGTALGLGLTAAFAVLWLLGAHVALRRANSRHILKNRREVE